MQVTATAQARLAIIVFMIDLLYQQNVVVKIWAAELGGEKRDAFPRPRLA
jgi:hypothetical protein